MCRPFRQLSTDRPPARYLHQTDYMKENVPHVDVFYKYKDIDLEKYELLITVSSLTTTNPLSPAYHSSRKCFT